MTSSIRDAFEGSVSVEEHSSRGSMMAGNNQVNELSFIPPPPLLMLTRFRNSSKILVWKATSPLWTALKLEEVVSSRREDERRSDTKRANGAFVGEEMMLTRADLERGVVVDWNGRRGAKREPGLMQCVSFHTTTVTSTKRGLTECVELIEF